MDSMTIFWLVLAVAMAVLEGVTTQLVSIWFVIGAVGACITSVFTPSIPIQVGVFVAISALALVITRPLVKRIKSKKPQPTNADRYIGRNAVVLNDIDNEKAQGMVLVDNQKWTARSVNGSLIPEGTKVKVTAIEGVKLIVSPVSSDNQ